MPATARVVPLSPVEGTFTYLVPQELSATALPGARVLVPFGRRTLTGVIVERTAEEGALKPIADVLDEQPALPEHLLELARWMAGYYVCSWGEALRTLLPAGTTLESRSVVRLLRPPSADDPPEAERLAALLAEKPAPLASIVGDGLTHHRVRRLAAAGLVAIEQELSGDGPSARRVPYLRLAAGVDAAAALAELRGAKQRALVEALDGRHYAVPQAEVLADTGASSATVKGLVEKGLVERVEREVIRTPFDEPVAAARDVVLHPAQQAALGAIASALGAGEARTFLLHGITGSGKTEVYIQALRQVLAAGRTGIVLVPEIALTPQTVSRFRAHFGDRVAVLHSRMSTGERFDAWRHLRGGRFAVAIGPRSAVFAPLQNLGLLVVDEEHEASYKQFDPAPRYHARDVAVMRARLEGAVCILGSATPSLESYVNGRSGKYALLEMPARVPIGGDGLLAQLPAVAIVDLGRERKVRRLAGALSHPLRQAMRARIARGEGVILLQNRRGYSPILICGVCGHAPACRDCAVSLTYHRSHRHLRCHYCGRVAAVPARCPECGAEALERVGAGTQRIEEEIREVFPEARTLRMDLDTTTRKGAHRAILEAFARGDADILLGTQMVAKGLDFPRVTLVGVVDADTSLLLPDFRSAERTLQLLMQVAGRAGRADLPGEVLIQTRRPEHPAVLAAARHDYALFAERELEERRQVGYPPFVRMAAIEFKGPDERLVAHVADAWTNLLRERRAEIDILGPEASFVSRIKRQYRRHTLLKAPRRLGAYHLPQIIREVNEAFGTPPGRVRINVDVDPVGVL